MYRMGEFEFEQYRTSEIRLLTLQKQQSIEVQEAYEGVHPTRVRFDYGLGLLSSESANVAEHAIYIADMKANHEKQQVYWKKRAAVFKEALGLLDDQEREIYEDLTNFRFNQKEYNGILNKLHDFVEDIVSDRPALQRNRHAASFEEIDAVEWDAMVDKMGDTELFEGYWDGE